MPSPCSGGGRRKVARQNRGTGNGMEKVVR